TRGRAPAPASPEPRRPSRRGGRRTPRVAPGARAAPAGPTPGPARPRSRPQPNGSPYACRVRTALVIAVPEAEPVVGRLRSLYNDAAPTGIPAHVTLLFPFGDRDDGLAELFARFEPFDFALTETRRWPDVLWLTPEPAEPFIQLTTA